MDSAPTVTDALKRKRVYVHGSYLIDRLRGWAVSEDAIFEANDGACMNLLAGLFCSFRRDIHGGAPDQPATVRGLNFDVVGSWGCIDVCVHGPAGLRIQFFPVDIDRGRRDQINSVGFGNDMDGCTCD
jgi:hypothetical protein